MKKKSLIIAIKSQGCRPWGCRGCHPQILADQLTLSQPEGADYAQQITTGTPGFSGLPTALLAHKNSAQVKTAPVKFAGAKEPLYNVDNQVPLIPNRIKQLNILYP